MTRGGGDGKPGGRSLPLREGGKGVDFTGKTTNILLAMWSDLPKNDASNLKTKDSS